MTLMAMYALPEAPMTDWMLECGAGYTLRLTPTLWTHGRKVEAVTKIPLIKEENDKGAH